MDQFSRKHTKARTLPKRNGIYKNRACGGSSGFRGRPSAEVLDSKIGAWGDFEWRTDAVDFPNMTADHASARKSNDFWTPIHKPHSTRAAAVAPTHIPLKLGGGTLASTI